MLHPIVFFGLGAQENCIFPVLLYKKVVYDTPHSPCYLLGLLWIRQRHLLVTDLNFLNMLENLSLVTDDDTGWVKHQFFFNFLSSLALPGKATVSN